METFEITNSLDWNSLRIDLEKRKQHLSMFKKDIERMLSSIDKEVAKLGNLEVIYRNKKSRSAEDNVKLQIQLVNSRIKLFNKYFMVAILSQDR
jgi:hypothetical protein